VAALLDQLRDIPTLDTTIFKSDLGLNTCPFAPCPFLDNLDLLYNPISGHAIAETLEATPSGLRRPPLTTANISVDKYVSASE
jgi:hypothetical protein